MKDEKKRGGGGERKGKKRERDKSDRKKMSCARDQTRANSTEFKGGNEVGEIALHRIELGSTDTKG